MLISMTGYGRTTVFCNNLTYEIELKSVNSKYLDISLKIPQALFNRDFELREIIKSNFNRGRINLTINSKKDSTLLNDILPLNHKKLENYLLTLKSINRQFNLKDKIKLEHILLSKELFFTDDVEFTDEDFNKIKEAINKASNILNSMKKKEGAQLEKDLIQRIKKISKNIKYIKKLSSGSVSEHFESYKTKLKQLLNNNNFELFDDRLKLELALLAEKADISEECVRLESHIKFFLETMKNENEPGRKLYFLCQEINREANTIASKALSLKIIHSVIEIKEEIERIREQLQNVE